MNLNECYFIFVKNNQKGFFSHFSGRDNDISFNSTNILNLVFSSKKYITKF